MKCVQPFISGRAAFGCGQCMPCRVNRRRMWANRILLESECHAANAFVTLTYRDNRVEELSPSDIRDWLKRFRKRIEPDKVRYYIVGEYGDLGGRPHYHAALFGYGGCEVLGLRGGDCKCRQCSVVRETWDHGHVFVGRLEEKSAQYIAKYTVKKMTHREDARLYGRTPEFARMSLKPGIGALALGNVALAMMQYRLGEVPISRRYNGKVLPFGRYLRKVVAGIQTDEKEKMQALLGVKRAMEENSKELDQIREVAWKAGCSVLELYAELNGPYDQHIRNSMKRGKL